MTSLQKVEREALTGHQAAVVQVVSGLRKYRQAVQDFLSDYYAEGYCSVDDLIAALTAFERICDDIEEN